MKDDIRNLYDALVKNGYSIDDLGGSEDNFRANMRDEKIRGEFYDWVVGRDDFNIGSREAYERRMTGALGSPTANAAPQTVTAPPAQKAEDINPTSDKSGYTLTAAKLGLPEIESPEAPITLDEIRRSMLPSWRRDEVTEEPKVEVDAMTGESVKSRPQRLRITEEVGTYYRPNVGTDSVDEAMNVSTKGLWRHTKNRMDASDKAQAAKEKYGEHSPEFLEAQERLAFAKLQEAEAKDPKGLLAHTARAERERLQEEKSRIERLLDYLNKQAAARRNEITTNAGAYQYGMAPVTGNQMAEITDPEMTKITAAISNYEEALRNIDRQLRGEKPGFWTGVLDATLRNPDFYTMNLSGLQNTRAELSVGVNGIKDDLDREVAESMVTRDEHAVDNGFLYDAGHMGGTAIPFVVSMVLNPAQGTIRGGSKVAAGVARKTAANSIKRRVIKAVGTTADDLAEAAVIASSTGAPMTIENVGKRMTGQAVRTETGDIRFVNQEALPSAIYKGALESIFEFYTEKAGVHVDKWVGKKGTKLLESMGASNISKALLYIKESDFVKTSNQVLRNMGVNDVGSEILEEELNILLNGTFIDPEAFKGLVDPEVQVDIIGGMCLTIGLTRAIPGTVASAGYIKQSRRLKKAEDVASSALCKKWEKIKSDVENATNEKIAKVVNGYMSDDQIANIALMDYYVETMKMRGYNIGTTKRTESSPGVEEEYQKAYAEETNAAEAQKVETELFAAESDLRVALGIDSSVDIEEALKGHENIDEETAVAIANYRRAKARMEGMVDRYQDTVDDQYAKVDEEIGKRVNKDNPSMVYSTMLDGQNVDITGGNVVLREDGMIDIDHSSDLYVTFPDGRVMPVSANKFASPVTVESAEALKAARKAEIDAQWQNKFDSAERSAEEQEKRDKGLLFNMTDPKGTHRVEIVSEGEEMSDILLDGAQMEIPTEELNRWKQEAGIQSTENEVQSADAVVDNTTDNGAPTESEANVAPVELPNVPDFFRLGGNNYSVASRNDDGSVDVVVDGKRETLPAGTDYSTLMPTDKKGEVQYEQMPVERTHEYFVQKVKDDEARAEMIEKRRKKAEAERKKFDKKPDPGIDPDAYEAKMTQWEADKKAAQAKVEYWNEVAKRDAEITRSETREAVENIKPDVMKETADEFIANQLAGIKITPESFKNETGLSNAEQAQLVGVISNDGVSVERAAEIITENYDSELKALGFTGDMQDVRDIIIDVLSQGNPRSYARKGREAREAENVDQQRAEAEAWARGAFDMTLEELYLYEETLLPRMMRDYEGFDENEYYSNLAENNGYDTTRESESIGRGGELLQGEQPVPAGGTPVVGQRNEGGAVSDDVQGGGQNGVAQEEVPVSEPVGNSEQLSSSEFPNNQSVAEGGAPGQSGVQKLADRILDRTEEKRRIPLRERARELEAQVGVKANIIESVDEVADPEARKRIAAGEAVAGWYSGGQVYLYMPNIKDRREIELTYVHEVVAHHGVKKLLGERFNEFLDGVWNMMSEADRARMLAYVGANENPTLQDMRAAADEYVAELAEKMNLGELEQSTWDKIVDWFKELLENIGFENLTKEDIESMLKASYSNLRAESGKGKTGSTENDFRARIQEDAESKKIFETAKEVFGTTYDMREAGYILPDGTMLDFSGKHQVRGVDKSFLNGGRTVDHREIENIAFDFDENPTGVSTDMADFLDRGAIRIDYSSGNINLNTAPTAKQKALLKRLIERNGGDVYVDFGKGWDTEHYAEYESARASRVLGDIDRYYNEGIKPINEHRTMFRISKTPAEFDAMMDLAVDNKGYVFPDLATTLFPIVEIDYHSFTGETPFETTENARKFAKSLKGPQKGKIDGYDVELYFSTDAVDKLVSDKGIKKSQDIGGFKGGHLAVVENIFKVLEGSRDVEIHPNVKKLNEKREWDNGLDKSVLCHRYYSAVSVAGDEYRVMIMVKESRPTEAEHKITPYTVEVQAFKIEKTNLSDVPEGRANRTTQGEMASDRFTDGAKLLKGVEKSYDKGKEVLAVSKNSSEQQVNPQDSESGIRFRTKSMTKEEARQMVRELVVPFAKELREEQERVQATEDSGTRFRITPEMDAEYMSAVENGDMETAERLVKEAARLAMPDTKVVDEDGYPMVVYHGSRSIQRFYTFDAAESNSKALGSYTENSNSFNFFADDLNAAEAYKAGVETGERYEGEGYIIDAFLDIKNPYIVDYNGRNWSGHGVEAEYFDPLFNSWEVLKNGELDYFNDEMNALKAYRELFGGGPLNESNWRVREIELYHSTNEMCEIALRKGHDGAIIKNVYDSGANSKPITDYVAFSPNQIKSADAVTYDDNGNVIPLSERFNEENNDIRFRIANKNQGIFVSNAQRAVEGIQQNKATAEQWLAMIKKNGGLKAGEDKWMGLSEWLENNESKSLTKQEVLDFVNENAIKIEEVRYNGDTEVYSSHDIYETEEFTDLNSSLIEYDEEENPYINREEYERLRNEDPDFFDGFSIDYWGEGIDVNNPKAAARYLGLTKERAINSTRLDYTTEGLENKREIALVVPTIEPYNQSDEVHFGDAGNGRAVAWVRFGETTDSEGNRVLVIDEIQSKRHQDAREKGYKDTSNLTAERQENGIWHIFNNGEFVAPVAKWNANTEQEAVEYYAKDLIPEAPFEKNWQELAMKRMLRLAAEEGFDKVAWTTGEQQAERYNIRHVVNELEVFSPDSEGEREVNLVTDRADIYLDVNSEGMIIGQQDTFANNLVGKSLSDILGKEVAASILAGEYDDTKTNGHDITFGGEGMKGFYDKMLPSFVQKYTKRWGAKVGEVTMPNLRENNTMHSVDVTPEMKESVMQGQTMFRKKEKEENIIEESQERARTEGAGETRFSTRGESIDNVPAQPLTLMERITNSLLEVSAKNKENLGLRADALKAFGKDITRVLSIMKVQKEYDKSTVDTLVKLAKMYFKNAQLLGEVDTYTMGRVLSLINNVVGKEDVTASAAKLMDILLDAHTKALAGILDKAEKVKAKKVNAAGVEVMGRLDKYGQKRVDEYRAAKEMTPEKLEEAIYDSDNRLAELEQRVREELGLPEGDVDQAAREYTGDNDVVNVYMDERARLEGLTLAREYKESIQQVQEEIEDLKRELKQAEEDYRLGNIDGKSIKEFRKSVAEAIMESKAGLIEGYHSLIYKFQENTKESSKKAKAFAQAQIDRAREIQHNANSDMEGISAATQGTHPKNYNNAVMNALRSPFPTFQGMLKKFGEKNVEGKGYLYERFIPQATKAGDNEFRGKVAARVMIEGRLKKIYGKKMTIAKFMKQLREYGATVTYREGNEMKQFDLTKGQMLYIYMVNKMSDGQMKLRRMGITDDVVAELMTKLPEEAVQFADWAQNELLKDLRGKYNAVHERVFGAPMAAIENYFPIKIRKEARGEKGDVSEVGQEGKPSTVTGSIIKRTKNATAIDLSADAMQVLMEHIDDMEHWAAFAEFNRDLNVLLNYKHFQNQIKNMTSLRYGSGEEMWKNFKRTAQIVSGTYRPSDSSIDRAVQNIAKGLTRSKINFRLYTAIKQLLSAPAFWTDAGVEELVYCYANPKGSFDWALENLPGFAERWQGRTMGNEKLLKSDSDWEVWRNKFVEKATHWGMTPNAAIDALTVAQGARAVYMTKLEQFKKAGYTEQRANEKALQAAAEAYNESQQSSEGMYLSPLQVEGTALAAVFTTFKNSNFGYTRKTAQAVANIKRKMRKGYKEETIAFMTKQMIRDGLSEENAKKMAEKVYNRSKYKDVANVAMFGFGLSLIFEAGGYAIYLLLGDDDEEKEKMMEEIALRGSLGLLKGIPFGETMISAAMTVKEGDTKYFRLPQLIAVGDIENLAQVLNYDSVRGANDLINMLVAAGVGVDAKTLTDVLVAIGDVENWADTEELGMFALRFVNAPQSNLDRLMVDDAMENSAINAEEIMQRYAEYKKSKNAPITQFLYSDEEEQKAVERYGKRFAKLLDERLENVVEDNDAYDLFYENADVKMKSKLSKMRQKYLAGDKAKDFEKLDAKELVERVLYGSGEINEAYFNLSTAEDIDNEVLIAIELAKYRDVYEERGKYKGEEQKEFERRHAQELKQYGAISEIQTGINQLKRALKLNPEKKDEIMANIRALYTLAIELINKYNNE